MSETNSREETPLPGMRGLEDTLSPVDLPPMEEERHPLRWTTVSIATATAFLALFNATALQGWAFGLEPSAATRPVVDAADNWYQQTAKLNLQVSVETLHGWWIALTEADWPGQGEASPEDTEDLAPPPPGAPAERESGSS